MTVFLSLFANLLPLYVLIALGYFAGRVLKVDGTSLSSIAIYIIIPFVFFGFIVSLEFELSYVALPLFMFACATIVSTLFLKIGKNIYGDHQANLTSICASMSNAGYFGLPVVFLLYDSNLIAIYIFMALGISVHLYTCLLYTSPSPRDRTRSRMPSSA